MEPSPGASQRRPACRWRTPIHGLAATLCSAVMLLAVSCARAPAPLSPPPQPPRPSSSSPEVAPAPLPVRDMTLDSIGAELWPAPPPLLVPMPEAEREHLSSLVAALTAAARQGHGDLAALAEEAAIIDFRLEVWRVHGRVFWALVEQDDHRRGGGAYVVRPGPHQDARPEILLQAPHAFFDRGTGDIAAALFFGPAGRGRARALFANTAYRYPELGSIPEEGEHSPADLAHITEHAFHLATERLAQDIGALVVIQLHGFAERPARPTFILSSGRDQAAPLLLELAQALADIFDGVHRYPQDIDELGATTNVQGRMLAQYPLAHFLHIEISAQTRRRLRDSPALLARFADAVLSTGSPAQREHPFGSSL